MNMSRVFLFSICAWGVSNLVAATEVVVSVRITPLNEVSRQRGTWIRVYANRLGNPHLLELKRVSIAADPDAAELVSIWKHEKLSAGQYEITVRDEPTMFGTLCFAKQTIAIGKEEKINYVSFRLTDNKVEIIPLLDGKSLPESDASGSLSYTLTLERAGEQMAIRQYQNTPLLRSKEKKNVAQFYYVEKGRHEMTLVELPDFKGRIITKVRQWKTTIDLPEDLPEQLKVKFETK